MCHYIDIAETLHGKIAISACCKNFRVIFNNIVFEHQYPALNNFYKNFIQCWDCVKDYSECDLRSIRFESQAVGISFHFCKKEIEELKYLLKSGIEEYHRMETYKAKMN